MGKPTGFKEFSRAKLPKRAVKERLKDFNELQLPIKWPELHEQAARCMDCGVPFCHSFGCPLHNRIPEWIDLVYHERWQEALTLLLATDEFPEFTGRVCPALCEGACTLDIHGAPVVIEHIELQIIERGFKSGWVLPQLPHKRSGKKVAVIGSGPAGLAAATKLNSKGHLVTVYEKNNRIGGLLRYGIPDFKLEKSVIDRRLDLMRDEGVLFETDVHIGVDISVPYLLRSYDAIVIAVGTETPRDLEVEGRDLSGIHHAMVYLMQQNRLNAGDKFSESKIISAKDKRVVVIGGGDTGADVVGTANRQGAKSVTQIEILPEPPVDRGTDNPWPTWPRKLRTASSHEEGCERLWSLGTLAFTGKDGLVSGVRLAELDWVDGKPVETGEQRELPVDLVILAMGFLYPEPDALIGDLDLELDERGNIQAFESLTSHPGVFAAGDCIDGPSLVVTAIQSGKLAAEAADKYLRRGYEIKQEQVF